MTVRAGRDVPQSRMSGAPGAKVLTSAYVVGQPTRRGSRRNGIDRPNLRRPKVGWVGLSK